MVHEGFVGGVRAVDVLVAAFAGEAFSVGEALVGEFDVVVALEHGFEAEGADVVGVL